MDEEQRNDFNAFIDAFWKDVDAGSVRPIDEYLAHFPDLGEQVRSEYVAYELIASTIGESPHADAPDPPASAELARLAKSPAATTAPKTGF